jgi:hypothetical protein
MKTAVRILAALNAVFQIIVGLLSVASPPAAAAAFKVEIGSPAMAALIRMFGGLLAASGILSGYIAKDPDRDRALCRVYAVALLVNVVTDVIVIGAGELRFDQLASGMILELVLAIVLLVRPLPSRSASA